MRIRRRSLAVILLQHKEGPLDVSIYLDRCEGAPVRDGEDDPLCHGVLSDDDDAIVVRDDQAENDIGWMSGRSGQPMKARVQVTRLPTRGSCDTDLQCGFTLT